MVYVYLCMYMSGLSGYTLSIYVEFHYVDNLRKYNKLTNYVVNRFPLITSNLFFFNYRETFVSRKKHFN